MGNEQDSRSDIGNVGSKLHDNKKVTDEKPTPYPNVRRVGGTRETAVIKRLSGRPREKNAAKEAIDDRHPERVEERNPHLALRQEVQQQLHRVVDRLNEINNEEEALTRQLEELEARVAAARLLETNN